MKHRVSCHCGKMALEVDAEIQGLLSCNCSICTRKGSLLFFVPRDKVQLLTSEDDITTYTFNKHVIKHRFCRVCGIKSFYIPRSNPDGVDVNARCLDEGSYDSIEVEPFDGANWEANAGTLAHLSS